MGTMKKTERTPAREALAVAIEELHGIEAEIEKADRAHLSAISKWCDATDALETFEREKPALASTGAHLIDTLARGDDGSVAEIVRADDREARELELRENVSTWVGAKDEIRTQITELNRRKEAAESRIKDRAAAVICEDPVVAKLRDGLVEMQEEVARRRHALHFVAGCFPYGDGNRQDLPGFLQKSGQQMTEFKHNSEWESALKALQLDADAELPI